MTNDENVDRAPGTPDQQPAELSASSFAKPLFCGEIHEDLLFPYHMLDQEERTKVEALIDEIGAFLDENYDPDQVEEQRWIGDDIVAGLGEIGALGLYVPEEYGGQGLSQTGYCRVFEEIGQVDGSLATVLGVHQSIGYKGLVLFGTDEQKARFLPDLVSGRKLAGFALTEPNAGSDAYHLETRAVQQADGSWILNGEKRYIGNGSKDLLTTFARDDEGGHVALLVEKGMEGFEVGERFDTLGLRGNDLRRLRFNDVRVPSENVLGEPGAGFELAMAVLNNGRMSLGTGCVGATKRLLDLSIDRVRSRHQFGQPIGDFELVEEKIAWMISYLFGLESMAYATTGLVDRGVPDYTLESAMSKIAATEFLWYAANRSFQLAGGDAYIEDNPYAKILRDIRVFPIFEGANDVLRSYVALTGLQGLGESLPDLESVDLRDPIGLVGTLVGVAGYVAGRIERQVRPDRITSAHENLQDLASPVTDQVEHLAATAERLLREHGQDIRYRQWHQKRLAHAAIDIYAQVATLSRMSGIFEDRGGVASSQERYIAETFCQRAERRVHRTLDQVEDNDDDRMHAIAQIAYQRGSYGYHLFEV